MLSCRSCNFRRRWRRGRRFWICCRSNRSSRLARCCSDLIRLSGRCARLCKAVRSSRDGFDGLARRGSIERLLLSEWLLLEEAPLEFLRRFSGGESAYFQLARRDPHAARASLALFDCGPQVLGGPRLVELAALLVLARRAQSAGATFRWGVWQKPGEWQGDVNRESVEWWLGLRAQGEPNVNERAGWEEVWEQENADFGRDELWLIGSTELRAFVPPRARFLEVADELDPFAPNRAVLAQLEGRTLRLELPDDALGARLLRDPFASASPKSGDKNTFTIPALDGSLVWAQSGWKLFARTRDGGLLAFSVPNSPSATVGPPKKHHTTGGLVAVGRVGRATVAAFLVQRKQGEQTTSVLRFQSWGRNSTQWNDVQLPFARETSEEENLAMIHAPMGTLLGTGDGTVLALWLQKKHLQIAVRGADKLRDESAGVRGVARNENFIEWLRTSDTQTQLLRLSSAKPNDPWPVPGSEALPTPPITEAWSGFTGHSDGSGWALHLADGRWFWQASGRTTELNLKPTRPVVGALFDGTEFGLLLHTSGERELWFYAGFDQRKLFRFGSPIQSVAVCPFAPLVAVSGDGEIGVWSLAHGAWLLRAHWD